MTTTKYVEDAEDDVEDAEDADVKALLINGFVTKECFQNKVCPSG